MKSTISTVLLALSVAACSSSEKAGPDRATTLREAISAASISLQDAIDAALASSPDARVTGAELESEDGEVVYWVELTTADGEVEVSVDPVTGEVLSTEVEEPEAGEEPDAPCTGEMPSFGDAIAAAEAATSGQAVEVETEGCEVTVQVLADDGLFDVEINADGTAGEIEADDEEIESEDGDVEEEVEE